MPVSTLLPTNMTVAFGHWEVQAFRFRRNRHVSSYLKIPFCIFALRKKKTFHIRKEQNTSGSTMHNMAIIV